MSKRSTKPSRPIRWSDVTKLDLLTEAEAAELLRESAETLESWRVQDPPIGPSFFRCGDTIRYPVDALRRFVRQQLVRSADDQAAESKEARR